MKTLLSWSTGKDSAWSLYVLRQTPGIEVAGLFTTVNAAFDRVAMHAVRRALLEAQAAAAGLPLHVIEIPWPCPNEAYEAAHGRIRGGADGARCRGHGLRRSLPGGYPCLSRVEARKLRASRRCFRSGGAIPLRSPRK